MLTPRLPPLTPCYNLYYTYIRSPQKLNCWNSDILRVKNSIKIVCGYTGCGEWTGGDGDVGKVGGGGRRWLPPLHGPKSFTNVVQESHAHFSRMPFNTHKGTWTYLPCSWMHQVRVYTTCPPDDAKHFRVCWLPTPSADTLVKWKVLILLLLLLLLSKNMRFCSRC